MYKFLQLPPSDWVVVSPFTTVDSGILLDATVKIRLFLFPTCFESLRLVRICFRNKFALLERKLDMPNRSTPNVVVLSLACLDDFPMYFAYARFNVLVSAAAEVFNDLNDVSPRNTLINCWNTLKSCTQSNCSP